LGLDATLVRFLWLMLVIFGGCGLIGYIIAWIIMPEEQPVPVRPATVPEASPQAASNR
jgi:phage shock protein C